MAAYLYVVETIGLFRNIMAASPNVVETIGLFETFWLLIWTLWRQ
jgi:hypothetical protein